MADQEINKKLPLFLEELLTDPDVVRKYIPRFLSSPFFRRVARKRAGRIAHDYEQIGGKSPIYDDTEFLASEVKKKTGFSVLTFHRYLPATHASFLEKVQQIVDEQILVFPFISPI